MSKKLVLIRHAKIYTDTMDLNEEGREWAEKLKTEAHQLVGHVDLMLYDEVDCKDKINRCYETIKYIDGTKTIFNKRGIRERIKEVEKSEDKDFCLIVCFRGESFAKLHEILKPDYNKFNTEYHKIFIYEFINNKWEYCDRSM